MTSDRYIQKVKFAKHIAEKHGCFVCSEKNPLLLDFDHLGNEDKYKKISSLYDSSWETFVSEINKCQILCVFCHYDKTWRKNNKKTKARKNKINLLKNKSCAVCGESKPRYLEFDHIDPSLKTANVSNLLRNHKKAKDEISKCRVLCRKCHRVKTCIQLNWYYYIPELRQLWLIEWMTQNGISQEKFEMLDPEQILYADFSDYT